MCNFDYINDIYRNLGRKEIVEILLRNAADVHAKDINKNTPLHVAVEFGKYIYHL